VLPMRAMALLCLFLAATACRREEKKPVRTEPWLAAAASLAKDAPRAPSKYRVKRGSATVELRMDQRPVRLFFDRIEGEIDVDFRSVDATYGKLRADLLSMRVEGAGAHDGLVQRALANLELTPDTPDSEPERFAELTITALDRGALGGSRRATLSAQGDLTLHRFRSPLVFEIEVEFAAADAAVPETLLVRTRRPLIVSLPAHGLGPAPAARGPAHSPTPPVPRFGKEARISAQIEAEPEGSTIAR
jgi:polyisoprenoid-binding protein YceI